MHSDLNSERFAHLVRQLERQFRRTLEEHLRPHDVQFGHWVFLRILWDEEGLSQRELADRSGLTTPTVHTAISKMEQLGMIERLVPEKNKSRPLVHLTPHGRDLKGTLEPLAVLANDAAMAEIDGADLDIAKSTLLKMIDNLNK